MLTECRERRCEVVGLVRQELADSNQEVRPDCCVSTIVQRIVTQSRVILYLDQIIVNAS